MTSGPTNRPDYAAVAAALEALGLQARGGFAPRDGDDVPPLEDGRVVASLVLAGNVGGSMWQRFDAAPRAGADPLDAWSREVLDRVAAELGATVFYPFGGPPYLPFQRWARRAEPVFQSPIGPLIHPRHGLWHAYRGALGFAHEMSLPEREEAESPCATCEERPCLSHCPVEAHSDAGFDAGRCIGHLEDDVHRAACYEAGCLARAACPVGIRWRYVPRQAAFHMDAFRRANRARYVTP